MAQFGKHEVVEQLRTMPGVDVLRALQLEQGSLAHNHVEEITFGKRLERDIHRHLQRDAGHSPREFAFVNPLVEESPELFVYRKDVLHHRV